MDTIGIDTYPLVMLVTGTAPGVFTQLDPVLRRGWAKAIRGHGGFYSRRGQENDGENGRLRQSYTRPFAAR